MNDQLEWELIRPEGYCTPILPIGRLLILPQQLRDQVMASFPGLIGYFPGLGKSRVCADSMQARFDSFNNLTQAYVAPVFLPPYTAVVRPSVGSIDIRHNTIRHGVEPGTDCTDRHETTAPVWGHGAVSGLVGLDPPARYHHRHSGGRPVDASVGYSLRTKHHGAW